MKKIHGEVSEAFNVKILIFCWKFSGGVSDAKSDAKSGNSCILEYLVNLFYLADKSPTSDSNIFHICTCMYGAKTWKICKCSCLQTNKCLIIPLYLRERKEYPKSTHMYKKAHEIKHFKPHYCWRSVTQKIHVQNNFFKMGFFWVIIQSYCLRKYFDWWTWKSSHKPLVRTVVEWIVRKKNNQLFSKVNPVKSRLKI